MLTTEALLRISKEVGAPVSRVETTVGLLESGATVPFIARYRKEVTGNLDEVKIRDIEERRMYYEALEERRKTVLGTIENQGKLTQDLKQRILACYVRNELEDLYLPFKPKRKTKATTALEKGLGPLAEYIWEQTGTDPVGVFAQQFVVIPETPTVPEFLPVLSLDGSLPSEVSADPESKRPSPKQPAVPAGPASVEEAIEGALHILAERIAENGVFRRQLRKSLLPKEWCDQRLLRARKRRRPSTTCTTNSKRPFPGFLLIECLPYGAALERTSSRIRSRRMAKNLSKGFSPRSFAIRHRNLPPFWMWLCAIVMSDCWLRRCRTKFVPCCVKERKKRPFVFSKKTCDPFSCPLLPGLWASSVWILA
jgi:hypothetical protein